MLCVLISYMKGEGASLLFKVDCERQIFKKPFMAIFAYFQSFVQKSAESKSLKKYFFKLRLVRDGERGFEFWPNV